MGSGAHAAEADAAAALLAAVDAGITSVHATGEPGTGRRDELLIRQVLRSKRDRIALATNFGSRAVVPGGHGRPEQCRKALDRSLTRLGADDVDLYCLREEDPSTPIEETVGALGQLVDAGKIRFIGLPAMSGEAIYRAHAVRTIAVVHGECSMAAHQSQNDLLPLCRELGIGFLSHCRTAPQWMSEDHGSRWTALAALAAEAGMPAWHLALAWVLHQGASPVLPARNPEDVRIDSQAACRELSAGVVHRLDRILGPGAGRSAESPAADLRIGAAR